jgi:putative endonuclease
LKKKRFDLVCRNWRCALGEIDLVMLDGAELVFVEVKTRISKGRDTPYLFENIRAKKKHRLSCLAQAFLNDRLPRDLAPPEHRIDAVGVLLNARTRGVEKIEHIVSVAK